MAKYALVTNGVVQTIIDTTGIPSDFPDIASSLISCDDSVCCNWTYDGTNFSAPIVTIPDVTPRQIRQALILSGVSLSSIDAALATLPQPTQSLAQAEWDYSVMFERNRPLVTEVAVMLGWTSDQLDALWLLAGSL